MSLTVRPGEFVVIVGASGAGKSTLLRTINGLVRPDSGQVLVGGRDISALRGKELRRLRRGIGLIFQDFNLVERAAVLTNVLTGRLGYLPAWQTVLGIFPPADVAMARQALDRLGLADRPLPSSGAQRRTKRRVSARAWSAAAHHPGRRTGGNWIRRDILGWFRRINEQENITVIVNLHDIGLAAEFDGRLVGIREENVRQAGVPGYKQTFARITGVPWRRLAMRRINLLVVLAVLLVSAWHIGLDVRRIWLGLPDMGAAGADGLARWSYATEAAAVLLKPENGGGGALLGTVWSALAVPRRPTLPPAVRAIRVLLAGVRTIPHVVWAALLVTVFSISRGAGRWPDHHRRQCGGQLLSE